MKVVFGSIMFLVLHTFAVAQTTIWQETFDPTPATGWNFNTPFGVNDPDANYWTVSDDESGMPPGTCGAAGQGNQSMYIYSTIPFGTGAIYNSGGLCTFFGLCVTTNTRAQTPLINTVGITQPLTLSFDYIENGEAADDDFFVQYSTNGGTTWTALGNPAKTPVCTGASLGQGLWTAYSIALPASCNNIANLRIGFCWKNDDDGNGTDPSVAINDIKITIPTSSNLQPNAQNDAASTGCNSLVNIAVLGNDNDPDAGQTISLGNIFNVPAGATATASGSTINFTPPLNGSGTYTFNYAICDNGTPSLCDTAVVTVTVGPCNTAPNAVNDAASTGCNSLVNIAVLGNDNDPDAGQTISLGNIFNVPAGATATASGSTINFTPPLNASGTFTFNYSICDNGTPSLCDTGIVTVTVSACNLPPNAVNDVASLSCFTNVMIPVLNNDNDPDAGQTISISSTFNVPSGTLVFINGGTIYFAFPGFIGTGTTYTFNYVICDNGTPSLCDTATVSVTDGLCNYPPNAVNDTANTACNTAVTIPVLINDSDPDPMQTFYFNIISNVPVGASATINGNDIIFTPPPNTAGTFTFNYTICDSYLPSACSTATVTVTVTGCNAAPNAVNDAASTGCNSLVNIAVLSNDNDPNAGQTISLSNIFNIPAGATATASSGTINFTPPLNGSGTYTFNYAICDNGTPTLCDTAVVTVTVGSCNTAPNAVNDAASTGCNSLVNIAVLSNDNDPNAGQTITLGNIFNIPAGATATASAGTINFTPPLNGSGTYTFNYAICDNGTPSLCDTAVVTVTVGPCNTAPNAVNDAASTGCNSLVNIAVLSNDNDPNAGQTITLGNIFNIPAGATATASSGTINFTPPLNANGTYTFNYVICDNGTPVLCDTGVVTVTVTGCNNKPTANDDAATTPCNTPVTINVIANDNDIDVGQFLSINSVWNVPVGATVTYSSSNVVFTPSTGVSGTYTLVYSICDNGNPSLCDTSTIVITVLNCIPVPGVQFVVSDSTICEDDCVSFTDQSTNAPTSWAWTFDGGTPATSILQNPQSICYDTPGTYAVTLVASNSSGAGSLVKTTYITVAPKPMPIVQNIVDTLNKTITLDATTADAISYTWTPIGGLSATGDAGKKDHVIFGATTYSCAVTTSFGCQVTHVFNIVPLPPPKPGNNIFWVPSAFSPNGDNVNDTWQVKASDVRSFRAKVYDRWGSVVFETNNHMQGWDGSRKGLANDSDIGVYYYYVEVEFNDGTKDSAKGDLTLIK